MPDQTAQSASSPRIAYVLQSFPSLTQTFVYREVLGLRRSGLDVETYAIWRPDEAKLSQESRHLVEGSHYVFPVSRTRFVRAHISFLFGSPGAYIGTLAFVLTRRGESLKNRRRTFFHFCEAVYLAVEMKARKTRHVHAHFSINAATIALVVSRLLDIPFSFTAHNILFTDRVILGEKIREARFIIAISEFTRQFLIHQMPHDRVEDKIHIVHCGISPDHFAPPDPKPVNKVPRLLFVAHLVPRKGASVLVEACRIMAEHGVAFTCEIIGDGPERPLLEQLVEKCGLRGKVKLLGVVFQEDLMSHLDRADLFVLPCVTTDNGDMDGIPVVLMEAMAMEIATVSTAISGIPELIEDGVSGLLVPEKDAAALADALIHLVEDPGRRSRLGKTGRKQVMRDFDIEKSTAQVASLFHQCLQDDV